MTSKRIKGAKTKLEEAVQAEINKHASNYESGAEGFLKDLMQGGCQSGIVDSLVCCSDTIKFFEKHKDEINELLRDMLSDCGCTVQQLLKDWDSDDPLAMDMHNQNLLAWFGFEETARKLADRNGIEI